MCLEARIKRSLQSSTTRKLKYTTTRNTVVNVTFLIQLCRLTAQNTDVQNARHDSTRSLFDRHLISTVSLADALSARNVQERQQTFKQLT